jgi:hypothetical protein
VAKWIVGKVFVLRIPLSPDRRSPARVVIPSCLHGSSVRMLSHTSCKLERRCRVPVSQSSLALRPHVRNVSRSDKHCSTAVIIHHSVN